MKIRHTPGRLFFERNVMHPCRVGATVGVFGIVWPIYERQPRLKVTCISRDRPHWTSYITERDRG